MRAEDHLGSAFESYGEAHVARSWAAAFFTSSAVYVLLGIAILAIGTATRELVSAEPEPITVTFVEKIPRPEPPPEVAALPKPDLPTPKLVAKPRVRAAAAAAMVPKHMKVRKLDEPPPPKELVAPKDVAPTPPKEVDARLDKGVAVYGDTATADAAGLEGGLGDAAGGVSGIFDLPEGAVAPKPSRRNRRPEYPRSARRAKRTGTVVVRCVVRADGRVDDVALVRGDEPFADAVLRVVKRWRYEPALHHGQRISVPHVIEVRFKLEA